MNSQAQCELTRIAVVPSQDDKFRALLEAAPDAMIIVDGGGTMVLVNGQAERLFGYSRGEMIGQKIELLVPARFRGRHPQHRGGYVAEPLVREMGSGLELYALRRDGTEFPVEISLSPIDTEEGPLVTSAIRDITERRAARQKDLLLKEIHHRVKNNLQVISSLLKLHAERMQVPEARDAFDDAQQRVRAIALLHEVLHDSRDGGPVDLESYARSLIASVRRLVGSGPELIIDITGVSLSLDQAMPCGLILNELVTNALKHAFCDDDTTSARRIRVHAERQADDVVLEVADNGRGIPPDVRPGSLGLHLVRTLARQLDGKVEFHADAGTRVRVVFPGDSARSPA